jgi:hypothetical protein
MGHLKTQKSDRERMWKWILPVSLVLICFAIMTPRLLSPQFGLLDDGVTLKIERVISEGAWDIGWETGGGRLRPGYLFYWSLIQMATGRNPFWFFFSNAIVLAATALVLFVLVQMLGGSRLQGWAAGMFFVLSGPVVETFYTLSKVEHIQVLGILLSLLAVLCGFRQPRRWIKIILFLGAGILLIWVYLSKEISKEIALIMVPISLAWVFVAWIFNKRVYGLQPIKMWISFFATNLLAAAVFLAFYVIYIGQSVAAQGYSQKYILDWKIIANSSIRWVGWLIYDFPFLIPLFLCLVILAILKKKLAQPVLILNIFIWMAGWILIFLPWSVIAEYYILPFSIGASIVSGIALGQIYDFLNTKTSKGRIFVISLLVIALPLFLITLINHVMNTRVQLTVDKNNALMIDKVAAIAPQNSLVLVNLNDDNEYIDEIRLHLTELYHRSDLTVDSFHFQSAIAGEADMLSYIVLMSSVENKMLLSVRIRYSSGEIARMEQCLARLHGRR